ncbi:hypothetical protein KXS07_23690 [Inquilinus limosus]|uniref:phage tail tape measure protein n=1 Tax=Inquilinus limosus TaxID=171674 RepID=UPI003F17C68D
MTDMRVALRIEGDNSSAKAALADTRQGVDQVKASAAAAGSALAPIAAIGSAAAGAAPQVEALGTAEQNAATAAAAVAQSSATAAQQVQQSGAAAATAATAIGAGLEAQTQAVNDNTRALAEATAALRAFLAAQDGAGGSLPGTVPPLSAQARALRDIVETADPAVRQTRLLAEAQDVLRKAVQEGTITHQRADEVLRRYEHTLQAGGAGMGRFGAIAQQAGYQVGDFAVQIASGQSWITALVQQGSQVLGVFGIWGAVLGGVVAVVGAVATGLGVLGDEADESGEAIAQHEKNLKEWIATAEKAAKSGEALALTYSGMTSAVREVARQQLQSQIDEQTAALDAAADQAITKLEQAGVRLQEAYSRPVGEFGQTIDFPAEVQIRLGVEIPPDLRQRLQTALQPVLEGNRDRTFLAELYNQIRDMAAEADGPAKGAITSLAQTVAGLSAEAQIGGQKAEVLEAKIRILLGTATQADYELVRAAMAADGMGRSFSTAAGFVDQLTSSIDRFLGTDVASKAEGFASGLLAEFRRMQAEADIRRDIENTRADAAAIGNPAAERARARQRAVDQARQRAARMAQDGQVINAQSLIDELGTVAGEKFDREQEKLAAKAAARAEKQKNAYEREIERIQKATDETKTQADAIGLTSRASAELTIKQQLLYAAQSAGIKVSEQLRAEIDKTAASYAEQSERLRQLQREQRQRQQLTSEAISLIGATATPGEELSRQYRQLGEIQAALQSMDPGVLERLAEAGYTVADAQEAIRRQLLRLNNPELFAFADDAKSALGDLARSITQDFSTAGDALETFFDRLADIAIDRFLLDPLVDRAGQLADGLMNDLLGGGSSTDANGQKPRRDGVAGLLDDLLGTGAANDNRKLAAADFTVATATINVVGGAIAGGGLASGLLPDRPDATLDKLAGDLAGDKLQGGAGTDMLSGAVDQVGDALHDVAAGVREEGSGFLSGFGGALGSIVNGFASLFSGDIGKGAGGILNGLLSVASSFLGFSKGAAFVGGTVRAFASGTVVTGPTYFPMADGAMGLMGEAGPEAIMPLMSGSKGLAVRAANANGSIVPLPLSRLSDGSLGVALPPTVPHARGGVFGSFAMPAPPPTGAVSRTQAAAQAGSIRGRNGELPPVAFHFHGVTDAESFRRSRGQLLSDFGAEMGRQLRRNGNG